MIASDVINRLEKRIAMIERERNEYQGKLPSVRPLTGRWGNYRNSSGLKSIITTSVKGKTKYAVNYYIESARHYCGIFDNVRSAVDCLCKECNIEPMQIAGMTKEGWDLIKSQPIIPSRTYKGGK